MALAGHDLTIGYSDRVVGRGLDVAVTQGEVLALLGPNGGGKTTLLKTLLGILKPRGGEVAIGGRSLADISVRERARLIAYVPQVHVPTFAFSPSTESPYPPTSAVIVIAPPPSARSTVNSGMSNVCEIGKSNTMLG